MDRLKEKVLTLFDSRNFDSLAVGVIDFTQQSFAGFELYQGQESNEFHFFDLASVTKPLTLSLAYLKCPKDFDKQMLLLLHHQAGTPSYGTLSKKNWRAEILQWPLKKSSTLYSDYGALRLMLEHEKKTGKKYSCLFRQDWDSQVIFWKELKNPGQSPATGMRGDKEIRGEVHDPMAYTIGEFCSHAGLFATLPGLCRTLLTMNKKYQMIENIQRSLQSGTWDRFIFGFDRVENVQSTLAGKGCSPLTFGHLGFTGTSFWIDPEQMKGHVILSNATQNDEYQKDKLNHFRREIGGIAWGSFKKGSDSHL